MNNDLAFYPGKSKNQLMVVGGGIAKESAIGGVMAQLDKTFPTNECSM